MIISNRRIASKANLLSTGKLTNNQNEFYSNNKLFIRHEIPALTSLNINEYGNRSIRNGSSLFASPAVNRNKFYQFSTPDYIRIENSTDSQSLEREETTISA
jgi:hypothetical protein